MGLDINLILESRKSIYDKWTGTDQRISWRSPIMAILLKENCTNVVLENPSEVVLSRLTSPLPILNFGWCDLEQYKACLLLQNNILYEEEETDLFLEKGNEWHDVAIQADESGCIFNRIVFWLD